MPADDQRGTCLVDEDGVYLVHDGIVQFSLHHAFLVDAHIVPKIIEPEFVVRAVSDVRTVRLLPFLRGKAVNDATDCHPEETVDLAHPLCVTLCQIIVDRDDVNALALQRIQVRRKRGDKRLALARLHLCNTALMQNHAAQQLYVKVAHPDGTLACFPHDGKGFAEKIVQRFAAAQSLPKPFGLRTKFLIRHCLINGLKSIDLRYARMQFLQFALARVAEQFVQKSHAILLANFFA